MGKSIGIDLGTTNTVAAVVDGPRVTVIVNRENHQSTRSVVGLRRRKDKTEILCGDVALDNWPMAPEDTIISIKRLMGRGADDPEIAKVRDTYLYKIVVPKDGTADSLRVVMGGVQYSPVQISAMILKKVKEDAEFRLNEEVTDAVITVPAYFSQAQKAATRRAGQEAGLRVIQILDEPTAAAISYGMETIEATEPKYLLVYDLGGGTFDISVLLWDRNIFVPLTLEGDMWLGGDNFDQALVDCAVGQIKKEHGVDPKPNRRFMAMLKKECQKAKETLSGARSADIIVASVLQDAAGNPVDVVLEVTREQFEEMIRPLVARTIALAEKALAGAELEVSQVSHVLMAGNSTCVPLVQQEVEKKFGADKVLRKVHPKQSVATGAAKLAAVLYGKLVCQAPRQEDPQQECGYRNERDAVTCARCGAPLAAQEGPVPTDELIPPGGIAACSYGIQTAGDKYAVFIKKNDPYPTPEENRQPQTFYTRMPDQRIIMIPVYGGETMDRASANEKQGAAVAILPARLPKGTAIRIRVWLDNDCVFVVSAHLEDGTDLKPWIMKGEADAKALEGLQRVDQEFEKVESELTADEHAEVDRVRNQAFDDMRSQRFDDAMQRAQDFKKKLEERKKGDDPLTRKAEGLVRYTRFVLDRYGWLLDPPKAVQLNQLAEQIEEAVRSGDRQRLEEKAKELDKATDELPQAARAFIGMFLAIHNRIQPVDPVQAANLLEELAEAEQALKARDPNARQKIQQVSAKIAVTIDQIGTGDPDKSKRLVCSCGTEIPAGADKCPKCGLAAWLVEDRSRRGL
ncbi:MAG TPA: Hsp70 family protein [Verrucomicrobiota bacterium]|nr:Hsp70 family protein [Verrucomicrobiota bacterium]HNU50830.1 Hsp70 family protein [Verrucomicrobiota bacterium]